MIYGDVWNLLANSATLLGILDSAKKIPNIFAPEIRKKIITDNFDVSCKEAKRFRQVIFF